MMIPQKEINNMRQDFTIKDLEQKQRTKSIKEINKEFFEKLEQKHRSMIQEKYNNKKARLLRHRTTIQLVYDGIKKCDENPRILTDILYRNTSNEKSRTMLRQMIECLLIEPTLDGTMKWRTTDKGREFIKEIDALLAKYPFLAYKDSN